MVRTVLGKIARYAALLADIAGLSDGEGAGAPDAFQPIESRVDWVSAVCRRPLLLAMRGRIDS